MLTGGHSQGACTAGAARQDSVLALKLPRQSLVPATLEPLGLVLALRLPGQCRDVVEKWALQNHRRAQMTRLDPGVWLVCVGVAAPALALPFAACCPVVRAVPAWARRLADVSGVVVGGPNSALLRPACRWP